MCKKCEFCGAKLVNSDEIKNFEVLKGRWTEIIEDEESCCCVCPNGCDDSCCDCD